MATHAQGTPVPAIFSFHNHHIRTVVIDDVIWFVATDVCAALDISNVTQAVGRLDDEERSMFNIGRQGKVNIINESGLYALILRSKREEARHFRKWVTSEVLPALRRTGRYEASVSSNLPLVTVSLPASRELAELCARFEHLDAWWQSVGPHIAAFNPDMAAEVTDMLDGARTNVHYGGMWVGHYPKTQRGKA